jgi:hypothetical protein
VVGPYCVADSFGSERAGGHQQDDTENNAGKGVVGERLLGRRQSVVRSVRSYINFFLSGSKSVARTTAELARPDDRASTNELAYNRGRIKKRNREHEL